MWKSKKSYYLWPGCLILAIFSICLILALNYIRKVEKESMPDYVEAGLYFSPPAKKTTAILFYPSLPVKMDTHTPLVLIGDKEQAEKIMDVPLEPKKIIEGRDWLEKIINEYNVATGRAKEKEFYGNKTNDGFVLFITPGITSKKGYSAHIGIDEDENTVCNRGMESGLLKKYFDEIGLTNELLADRPKFEMVYAGTHFTPKLEKTVSILLYHVDSNDMNTPVALLGDKDLTEKLMGHSLNPKILVEGREWLGKIINAYNIDRQEFEDKKFHHDPNYLKFTEKHKFINKEGRFKIVFAANRLGYKKVMGIEDNTICDLYMESDKLKTYFDELGLTKELLTEKPK